MSDYDDDNNAKKWNAQKDSAKKRSNNHSIRSPRQFITTINIQKKNAHLKQTIDKNTSGKLNNRNTYTYATVAMNPTGTLLL